MSGFLCKKKKDFFFLFWGGVALVCTLNCWGTFWFCYTNQSFWVGVYVLVTFAYSLQKCFKFVRLRGHLLCTDHSTDFKFRSGYSEILILFKLSNSFGPGRMLVGHCQAERWSSSSTSALVQKPEGFVPILTGIWNIFIPSIFTNALVPAEEKQPQSMILSLPCLYAVLVMCSVVFCQAYFWVMAKNAFRRFQCVFVKFSWIWMFLFVRKCFSPAALTHSTDIRRIRDCCHMYTAQPVIIYFLLLVLPFLEGCPVLQCHFWVTWWWLSSLCYIVFLISWEFLCTRHLTAFQL